LASWGAGKGLTGLGGVAQGEREKYFLGGERGGTMVILGMEGQKGGIRGHARTRTAQIIKPREGDKSTGKLCKRIGRKRKG